MQAQFQRDLRGLNKQVQSKQADLGTVSDEFDGIADTFGTTQAQCQQDLEGLNKQVESKQADLGTAQQALQQQQKTEAVMHKRIQEADWRLQVSSP